MIGFVHKLYNEQMDYNYEFSFLYPGKKNKLLFICHLN